VAKTFPADFYVTCATVIPVLFIALAVQGSTHDDLLSSAKRAARRRPMRQRDGAASAFLPALAYLTLMAGVTGEWAALGSLFSQSDDRTTRVLVMVMTLYLMILTSAGPVRKYFKADSEISELIRRADPDEGQEPATPGEPG
jgi:hypothetical protein